MASSLRAAQSDILAVAFQDYIDRAFDIIVVIGEAPAIAVPANTSDGSRLLNEAEAGDRAFGENGVFAEISGADCCTASGSLFVARCAGEAAAAFPVTGNGA